MDNFIVKAINFTKDVWFSGPPSAAEIDAYQAAHSDASVRQSPDRLPLIVGAIALLFVVVQIASFF